MEVLKLFVATFSALSAASEGQPLSKTFRMYNELKPSLPILQSFAVNGRVRCHGACLRRADCFSFLVTDTNCNMFGSYITDSDTELQPAQPGDIFNNLAPAQVVLQTLKNLTTREGVGHLHVLPSYPVKTGGRVIQWKFRCSSAGVIMLGMWRHVSTDVHQLVGRTRVTVTEDMANDEIITYGVPSTESFLVEEGDYMGFHSTNTDPFPNIHMDFRYNGPMDGFALEDYSVLGYHDSLKDEDFEIGDTFTKTSPHFHRRIVSLAVYIA